MSSTTDGRYRMLPIVGIRAQSLCETIEREADVLGALSIADSDVSGRTEKLTRRNGEARFVPHPRGKATRVAHAGQPGKVHATVLRHLAFNEALRLELLAHAL